MFKGAIYLKEYAILDLLEMKVVKGDPSVVSPSTLLSLLIMATGLNFDLQKELLMLQLQLNTFKLKTALERELTVEIF